MPCMIELVALSWFDALAGFRYACQAVPIW
jgi:hypothetical protein